MTKKKKPSVKQTIPSPEMERPITPIEAPVETEPAEGADSSVCPEASFPIVGLGASAGGLAAIEAFFAAMPTDKEIGMAFVVVQHLDPNHKSILMDLIMRYTKMQVFKVEDGMEVQPNCTYVIPPNRDMAFINGKLHLLEPSAPRGLRLPIDYFFRSLAQDQHERAICIVLSGTGTDGTLGLKAIKGEGGMAMVQAPESAAYDGMPRSAIATGLVDFVMPPDSMPKQLIVYVQHAFGRRPKPIILPTPNDDDILQKVFILLRAQTGHDFSLYKRNTIHRRIERRLALAQMDRLEDYVRYLRQTPLEVETLFRDLLIGVTNFFRDPPAFESLQEHVIRRLFDGTSGGSVRIWVPGCSSGEEAYSLAILIREYLDELKQSFQVQVFATDIDAKAIEKARAGVYPNSIAADVSPKRLARFFVQDQGGNSYHVSKSIRDLVVFAEQDALKDPPFSRLDLISCRNLLIYLGGEAQKKILPLFHYALNQDRYLFLGNSETIGEFMDLFAGVDRRWKIYQRKGVVTLRAAIAPYMPPLAAEGAGAPVHPGGARDLAEQVLLEAYAPASVLINAEFDVLYIHGRTGKYLEPAAGDASLNLLHMAREGLRMELTAAARKALTQQAPVRYEGLQVKSNGDTSVVNLIVQPVTKPKAACGLLMVIFEDVTPADRPAVNAAVEPFSEQEQRLLTLERELRTKGEYLQAIIEELETTNEELKSTNEELQSSNEELQSTNEELETSKEELQSVNEELVTVNTELQKKIEELSRANNDMNNLMASTNIGTLFLDHQLRIQRFTPATARVINLIQTDIGRPVSDIVSRFKGYDRLVPDAREVLDTLIPMEAEVQTQEGQWYQMRIQPYRTLENVIEGAVLTFVEITEQKELQTALRENEEKLSALFQILPVGVSVLDAKGKIVYVNPALERMLDVTRAGLLGSDATRQKYLRPDGTPMPAEESAGARAEQEQRAVPHIETGVVKEDGSVVWTDVSAVPLALPGWRVVIVTFDLAARRRAEETLQKPGDVQ
ncbi:MAG: chemotaxis protein CheB [Acidobacteriota bacterium]|jgi:two-component system CheB/CheR fusion protein